MKILLLMLPAVLATTAIQSAETATAPTRLLRHPTYSNGKVAFSHLGDIWIANDSGSDVRRLTDHQARDVYPRFSPDGKWIAFSSARNGNSDVFVISVAGGKPRQLTFHSAVIGTGSYRLMDGSSIRTPGFGVFTAAGENLENYGVQPDVFVDNTPEDFLAGRDRQIEKALEVLSAEMK